MQQPGNYDLTAMTFSNCKSTHTVKGLVGICANGIGLMFTEIYL